MKPENVNSSFIFKWILFKILIWWSDPRRYGWRKCHEKNRIKWPLWTPFETSLRRPFPRRIPPCLENRRKGRHHHLWTCYFQTNQETRTHCPQESGLEGLRPSLLGRLSFGRVQSPALQSAIPESPLLWLRLQIRFGTLLPPTSSSSPGGARWFSGGIRTQRTRGWKGRW